MAVAGVWAAAIAMTVEPDKLGPHTRKRTSELDAGFLRRSSRLRRRERSWRHRLKRSWLSDYVAGANNSCGLSRPLSWCRPSDGNGSP